MKKFVSLILALVMVLSMTTPAIAADFATLTLTTDKNHVTPGDTVTVKISIDKEVTNLMCYGYRVYFNADLLEITGRTPGNGYTTIGGTRTDDHGTYVIINALDTNGLAWTLSAGTIAEIAFTAREGASGNADFELVEDVALIDYDTMVEGMESVIVNPANDVTIGHVSYRVTVSEITNGTVTADKQEAEAGDTVSLTVTPAEGYMLDTLTVTDAAGGQVTVTDNAFTMPASAVTVAASFKQIPPTEYTITVTEHDDGTITIEKQSAPAGENIEITVTPDEGYELDTLAVTDASGTAVAVTNNTFTMPASNVTVAATFKQIQYTVTIGETTNGSVTADKAAAVAGETVTLTVAPAAGYMLNSLAVTDASGAAVTVTNNTFTMPVGNVTVSAAFNAIPAGYTVTMPADLSVVAGEIVNLPVVVDNLDTSAAYNAFEMSFTYDTSILKLTTTGNDSLRIEDNNGVVNVYRYGSDLTVGSAAFNLTFEAIGIGETAVTLTSAKVGLAASAHELDANSASILDDATVVTVNGYTVTLPEEFTGDPTVAPGEDYTFEALDKNYNYTVSATVDGETVTVKDNGDGTFTVEDVDGNLVITTAKEGKTFDVTLGDDMTGDATAQYMMPYTATLRKSEGYAYTISVTIGGVEYTGFGYDEASGTITIPGAAITGVIVFNTNKTAVQPSEYTVTFEGSGAGEASGEATVAAGADYAFIVNKVVGYEYTVSYKMGDSTESVALTEADGKYTITNVTGNLVITIEKESNLAVEVREYVTLNDKRVYLVRANGTLAEGQAYAYDGTAMYYSNVYQAWSWLVIVGKDATFTADDAKTKITAAEAGHTTLDQNYDVNMSGKLDINDAQLVYNVYNCAYEDFSVAAMQKFLYADLNGDGIVNINDAAAVVNEIVLAAAG